MDKIYNGCFFKTRLYMYVNIFNMALIYSPFLLNYISFLFFVVVFRTYIYPCHFSQMLFEYCRNFSYSLTNYRSDRTVMEFHTLGSLSVLKHIQTYHISQKVWLLHVPSQNC